MIRLERAYQGASAIVFCLVAAVWASFGIYGMIHLLKHGLIH